jgi:hypothetical protein
VSGEVLLVPAPLPWIKFWVETIDDPKVALLDDRTYRIWTHLLLLAQSDDPGYIRLTRTQLAWRLRRTEEVLQETLSVLAKAGLLVFTAEEVSFPAWVPRQYGKPSNAPKHVRERVARHRASHVTPTCNADVKRGGIAGEGEGEGDKSREEVLPLLGEADASPEPEPQVPAVPVLVEWPPGLVSIREQLGGLSAPPEFQDPPYWQRIDDWLGPEDSGVAYMAEFKKFLAWHDALPKTRRKKNLRHAFRNWLAKAESWSEQRAQRQAVRTER